MLEALDGPSVGAPGGSANNSFLRVVPAELEGKEVTTYRTFPLRETDALLNTEARVV